MHKLKWIEYRTFNAKQGADMAARVARKVQQLDGEAIANDGHQAKSDAKHGGDLWKKTVTLEQTLARIEQETQRTRQKRSR